jgi:hypothetical protein
MSKTKSPTQLASATPVIYAEGVVTTSKYLVAGRNGKKYPATETRIYIFRDFKDVVERLTGRKVRLIILEAEDGDKRRRR